MGDLAVRAMTKGSEKLSVEGAQQIVDAQPDSASVRAAEQKAIQAIPIQERANAIYESFAIKMAKGVGGRTRKRWAAARVVTHKGANAMSSLVDKIVGSSPHKVERRSTGKASNENGGCKIFPQNRRYYRRY